MSGISQVSRRPILCLCPGPRPRPDRRTLATTVSSMLPLLTGQQRLQRNVYIEATAGLKHLLSTLQERCCHRHMQDSLPAGWLAFTGWESNPLDRDERFPSSTSSSPFPEFILTLPVSNLGMSAVSLPIAWRGLNAGSCTPLPRLVCPQPRLSGRQLRECRFYQAGRLDRPRRPPSVQSPFAQLGCYLRWGDVIRLLRGHYSSVVARTGSCAAPVGLSPPSAFGLVWRVLAGCNQSLLPTAASRRYLQQSVLGCWIPYPGGTPCARACFFHGVIGLPQRKSGSASRSYPA